MDTLLELAKDRLAGIVAGKLYPAPGALIQAPLELYLIDIPPRGSTAQRMDGGGAPCIKLAPLAGGGIGMDEIYEEFAVQFIFYAGDHVAGYRMIAQSAAEIMSKFYDPYNLGPWQLDPGYSLVYGKTVSTPDGTLAGIFAAPYYHVTYTIKAHKQGQ